MTRNEQPYQAREGEVSITAATIAAVALGPFAIGTLAIGRLILAAPGCAAVKSRGGGSNTPHRGATGRAFVEKAIVFTSTE